MTPLMWRIIDLMLLLALRKSMINLLLLNLRLWRSLSSLRRRLGNLTLHSWLVVPLLDLFWKCYLLIAPIAVALGNGST